MTEQIDPTPLQAAKEAVRADPAAGKFRFTLRSGWQGGYRVLSTTGSLTAGGVVDSSRVGQFVIKGDEPLQIDGTDSAPNSVEYLLQALAGCFAVTLAANAALLGLTLKGIDLALSGELDLGGFLGEDRRPGLDGVRLTVALDAPGATQEQLRELVALAEQRSVIRDTIAQPTPIAITLA